MISFRPKAVEEGVYEGLWVCADGSPVTDGNGIPVPQLEIYVENDGPDAWVWAAIGAVILFCATFDVSYTYEHGNHSFTVGC